LFLSAAGGGFSAEVSEKMDIAIFGLTYYSYDIPDNVLGYIDSSVKHEFVGLKRFNILGYGEYRMESQDIDEFVDRIREIKAEEAKDAGTYDEKFGTIVIKGEDFDRIVNSFLVVIPSLSNYSVGTERQEYVVNDVVFFTNLYVVDIVVDINFVNVREGTQKESLRISGTATDESIEQANRKAVENAISDLTYRINDVLFEQGLNLGLRPGDEYQVMTKQEVGSTGKIVELPTGLVKVKKVYPEITEARIVIQKEKITEGDQLVEVSRLGAQMSFQAGVMQAEIPDMKYKIALIGDDKNTANYYYIDLDQAEIQYAPQAGVRVIMNYGYRLMGLLDLTALLNFPLFGVIGEFGVGTSLYMRRFSLELLASGGLMYMTTFREDLARNNTGFSYLRINGERIDYDDDPILNIAGFSVGVKGGLGINYRISPNASVRAGAGYRLYTPIRTWHFHIEETAGDKDSTDITDDSDNNYDELEGGMKVVNISGFEITLSLSFRF
jgi:hypothetical protein